MVYHIWYSTRVYHHIYMVYILTIIELTTSIINKIYGCRVPKYIKSSEHNNYKQQQKQTKVYICGINVVIIDRVYYILIKVYYSIENNIYTIYFKFK